MSKTYVAAFTALLSGVLPLAGFEVYDSEMLADLLFNVITVAAAVWAIAERVKMGDITWAGIRKR